MLIITLHAYERIKKRLLKKKGVSYVEVWKKAIEFTKKAKRKEFNKFIIFTDGRYSLICLKKEFKKFTKEELEKYLKKNDYKVFYVYYKGKIFECQKEKVPLEEAYVYGNIIYIDDKPLLALTLRPAKMEKYDKIILVDLDSSWTDFVKKVLEKHFIFEVEVVKDEIKFYNSLRRQYNAELLLDYFVKKYGFVFVLTDEDIYVEGLNFVFGLASPYRGCILSTYRLRREDRIKKDVLHEMGHVFGLKHCNNYCVMQFSNSVLELDLKPDFYCERCYKKIKIYLRSE